MPSRHLFFVRLACRSRTRGGSYRFQRQAGLASPFLNDASGATLALGACRGVLYATLGTLRPPIPCSALRKFKCYAGSAHTNQGRQRAVGRTVSWIPRIQAAQSGPVTGHSVPANPRKPKMQARGSRPESITASAPGDHQGIARIEWRTGVANTPATPGVKGDCLVGQFITGIGIRLRVTTRAQSIRRVLLSPPPESTGTFRTTANPKASAAGSRPWQQKQALPSRNPRTPKQRTETCPKARDCLLAYCGDTCERCMLATHWGAERQGQDNAEAPSLKAVQKGPGCCFSAKQRGGGYHGLECHQRMPKVRIPSLVPTFDVAKAPHPNIPCSSCFWDPYFPIARHLVD